MMADFELVADVMRGAVSLTREKRCQRCGNVATEKVDYFRDGKPYYPHWEHSGHGTLGLIPWDLDGIERQEIPLCPKCAYQLSSMIKDFVTEFSDYEDDMTEKMLSES